MGIVQMPPVCPIDGVILNDVLGICESWTKLNDWEKYEDYIRMTEEAAKNSKMTVAEWEYVNWSKAIQEKNSRKTNESKGGRKPTPRNSIHKKNGNDKIIEEERVMLNGIEFFIFVGKKAGIDHYYCQIRHWVKDSIDINTLSDAQAIFANFAITQHPWKSRNHLYKYVEFSDKEGAENLKKAKELKDNIFAFIQTKLKS